ncbi:MAG: ABC transporter ATP-binding protein, partial [Eubacteriales bacterium]
MESYQIEHLSFRYALNASPALRDISLTVSEGEFVTVCGKSGSGKSTLLRQLKPSLAPHGEREGRIYFCGRELSSLTLREQTGRIGFVLQHPENQLVTDKVWHELAFGAESLGLPTPQIRARVAEMASFFGIQNWFYKDVRELSGGQKQLLNLASVMVMQPAVLLLDEPTAQLDPIAAEDFLATVAKINRELGTTVILTEHRLEEAFSLSDRVIVMEQGAILANRPPRLVAEELRACHSDMIAAL